MRLQNTSAWMFKCLKCMLLGIPLKLCASIVVRKCLNAATAVIENGFNKLLNVCSIGNEISMNWFRQENRLAIRMADVNFHLKWNYLRCGIRMTERDLCLKLNESSSTSRRSDQFESIEFLSYCVFHFHFNFWLRWDKNYLQKSKSINN